MKKLLFSFCTILALSLVSCGGSESDSSERYYYDDYSSEESEINFKGGHERGHCHNNYKYDHIDCYQYIPDGYGYCANCGCAEGFHYFK